MRDLLRHLAPRTIAGNVVLLVAVSVVLFHIAMTAAMRLAVSDHDRRRLRPEFERFVEFVRILDEVPRSNRAPVIGAIVRASPRLELRLWDPSGPGFAHTIQEPSELNELRRELGPGFPVFLPREFAPVFGGRHNVVAVRLQDGSILTGILSFAGPNGPPKLPLVLGSVGFMVLNLAVLLWWATRGLTAPLGRFARTAESFSLDDDPAPLPERRGPNEVRVASRALNRMQERIRAMIEDRTRMLAAVSHDLRTPITRLRLRAEFIEDEATRGQILRDLEQMNGMVQAALSYLRDGRSPNNRSLVDLTSLLRSICDDFADMGESVTYQGPDHVLANVGGDEVERAVTNLVENAVRYGGTPVVCRLTTTSSDQVEIEIVDQGPGIPEERKAAMLMPFARGDVARAMNSGTGGFGLGLAIARSVAEAHGGELVLRDCVPSGLRAVLRLPRRLHQVRTGTPPVIKASIQAASQAA